MSSFGAPLALALSGGGFRAAAFHLGTLRALKSVGLLDEVRVLSTASGGSLLAALWVQSVANGEPFETFDAATCALLERNLVQEAMERLHSGPRRPSLVQRAADVYDAALGGLRLGALSDDERVKARFDHVVLNATHFSTGYGFRFTFPPRARAPFGNRTVTLTPADAWRDVRLGDAVAASACFPAGFEPFLFPSDFTWSGPTPSVRASHVYAEEIETELPLMDGGIHDNQATGPLLLLNESEGLKPGLVLCSDTDTKQMPFFVPPTKRGLWRLPIEAYAYLSTIAALGFAAATGLNPGWPGVICAVFATLFALPPLLLLSLVRAAKKHLPFAYDGAGAWLLKFRLGDFLHFVTERFSSVLTLTTRVFMYRVRALAHDVARHELPNRIVAAQIYDVSTKDGLGATDVIRDCCERARRVPTALWMNRTERDDTIAAGHATTIAVLNQYLERWQHAGASFRPGLQFPAALFAKVEAEWARLKALRALP